MVAKQVDEEPNLEPDEHGSSDAIEDAHDEEPGFELHGRDAPNLITNTNIRSLQHILMISK